MVRPYARDWPADSASSSRSRSFALGVILISQWPASPFIVLGTLVAVELISRGAPIIGVCLAVRSAVRGSRAGAHA